MTSTPTRTAAGEWARSTLVGFRGGNLLCLYDNWSHAGLVMLDDHSWSTEKFRKNRNVGCHASLRPRLCIVVTSAETYVVGSSVTLRITSRSCECGAWLVDASHVYAERVHSWYHPPV